MLPSEPYTNERLDHIGIVPGDWAGRLPGRPSRQESAYECRDSDHGDDFEQTGSSAIGDCTWSCSSSPTSRSSTCSGRGSWRPISMMIVWDALWTGCTQTIPPDCSKALSCKHASLRDPSPANAYGKMSFSGGYSINKSTGCLPKRCGMWDLILTIMFRYL